MKMPRRIWARVEELPIETLAWAMGAEFSTEPKVDRYL